MNDILVNDMALAYENMVVLVGITGILFLALVALCGRLF